MTKTKKKSGVGGAVAAMDYVIAAMEGANDDSRDSSATSAANGKLPKAMPVLSGIQKPIFPGMVFPALLTDDDDIAMARVAMASGDRLIGFALREPPGEGQDENAKELKLFRVGTAAFIRRSEETAEGHLNIFCQGRYRIVLRKVTVENGRAMAEVEYPAEVPGPEAEVKALCLAIKDTMYEIVSRSPLFTEEAKALIHRYSWNAPGSLADFAVTLTSALDIELQDVLGEFQVRERLEKALRLLKREGELSKLKEDLSNKVEAKMSKSQREYFLREQLNLVKAELGLERDTREEELDRYRQRLEVIRPAANPEAIRRIEDELDKLKNIHPQSPDYSIGRTYLDWLTELPWEVTTEDKLDVAAARALLERDHYGLEDVKKRILEFIGVAKLKGSVDGSILCLVGPPGVGKTSLGRSIAEALGRKFFRFSLGGMRDEAEIKGHRRTYIGALPGKIINAIKICGSCNPVIMLDEVDKIGQASLHGDPASALLEVLDPEQNSSFRDHYLDIPFDLSRVLFIATANMQDTIPSPLLDRMEVITLSGYITEEKLCIGKRHLIPKLLPRNGLKKKDLSFTDSALRDIILGYAREAGVRAFEKSLGTCMRKVAAGVAEGLVTGPVRMSRKNLSEYLGPRRFEDDQLMRQSRAGVAMGLAWTALGGSTLYVESLAVSGPAGFKQTGQLGEVMKESTQIAYTMVEANAAEYGLDPKFFREHTIHVHVPAGATPKDGPSAGITVAISLISLALGRPTPSRWAMTGELTLTGRVLPVGGIKEKMIAAKRANVRDLILPKANLKDMSEIPDYVREGLDIHYVEDFSEVFDVMFPGQRRAASPELSEDGGDDPGIK
ncbi:MAG: endopeptidase La [Lentisphaeria bacterium]|nr:endopeptidase La [Lentisphaeria bacterium]